MSKDTKDTEERSLQAKESRKSLEQNIKNLWGHSDLGLEAKKAAMSMLSTKTGMYARIPIVCKSDECPYSKSCMLLEYDLAPEGEYCPVETAQIELRYYGYDKDFDLEESSFTDRCLVSEIISCDIMMERCKALMGAEGVPVVDVVAGVGEDGTPYHRPEVSKYWEAYERAQKKRNEAYQLMMATRKDQKNEDKKESQITTILSHAAKVEEKEDE